MENYKGKYLFKYCNMKLDKEREIELNSFEELLKASGANIANEELKTIIDYKGKQIDREDYLINSVISKGDLMASTCKGFRDVLEYNNREEYNGCYDCNHQDYTVFNIKNCCDCLFYNEKKCKCNILNIEHFNNIYGKSCGINNCVSDSCSQMILDFLDYRTIAVSFSSVLDNFSLLDWCSGGKGLLLQYKVVDNSKLFNIKYIKGYSKSKMFNLMRQPNDMYVNSEQIIGDMREKFCEKNNDFCNEREVRFISDSDINRIDSDFSHQIVNEQDIGVELDSIIIYKNYYFLSNIGMTHEEKKNFENDIINKFKVFNKPIIFIQMDGKQQFIHIYIDGKIKTFIHLYYHKDKKDAEIFHKDTFYMLEYEKIIGIECEKEVVRFYFVNEETSEERMQEMKWRNGFY